MGKINPINLLPYLSRRSTRTNTGTGFTLIEILVVVLIIGILAAIALPQYQKAVTRARASQLNSMLSTVVDASNMYYLQHGSYPTSFDELEVDLPFPTLPRSESTCDKNLLPTSVKRNGNLELTIYNANGNLQHNFISAHFIDGKYKCSGFVHYNYTGNGWGNNGTWMNGHTFCAEYLYNRNGGEYNCKIFCQQVMGKRFKKYIQLINLFE